MVDIAVVAVVVFVRVVVVVVDGVAVPGGVCEEGFRKRLEVSVSTDAVKMTVAAAMEDMLMLELCS